MVQNTFSNVKYIYILCLIRVYIEHCLTGIPPVDCDGGQCRFCANTLHVNLFTLWYGQTPCAERRQSLCDVAADRTGRSFQELATEKNTAALEY